MEHYDLAVIGAGQGGLPATFMAARLGSKVAVVEWHKVGGT
jgi:pyruvate/2-oxoglutarate dehydrogenase complex dihydrolipoamide dehydrogenase (E3) component